MKFLFLFLVAFQAAAQPAVVKFTNAHHLNTAFLSEKSSEMRIEHLIRWVDSSGTRYLKTPPGKIQESLSFSPEEKGGVFQHMLNFIDYRDFPLFRGDQLTITYSGPEVVVRNRDGLSYPDVFAGDKSMEGYSAWGAYHNSQLFAIRRLDGLDPNWYAVSPAEIERKRLASDRVIRLKLAERVRRQMVVAWSRNDSLNALGQLPPFLFDFNRNKIMQIRRQLDFDTGNVPDSTLHTWFDSHQSSALGYPDYYYGLLRTSVLSGKIVQPLPFVMHKDGTNRDYRVVFDSLAASRLFPEKDRKVLLVKELDRIHEAYSRKDFLAYFARFRQLVPDTAVIARVREEYALDFDEDRTLSNSLVLTTFSGKKTTLTEVLKKHQGKIIYVDFWASWCAPCRKALPASAALRESLKNKEVVFLYLSLDQSLGKWKQAAEAEKLHSYADSYLIVNAPASDFVRKQKIGAIPRYMIFDKHGQLSYPKAPGAENTATGMLLGKLAEKP